MNATFLQPFINDVTSSQTTFFLNTETTYDWSRQQWTVPINAGVNQLVSIGGHPALCGKAGWRAGLGHPAQSRLCVPEIMQGYAIIPPKAAHRKARRGRSDGSHGAPNAPAGMP